ncbi:c-type cytochrome [Roseivivax sp. CAU 1753]
MAQILPTCPRNRRQAETRALLIQIILFSGPGHTLCPEHVCHRSWERKMIHQSKSIVLATILAASVPVATVAETIGQGSFMANCAVCHGADGKGNGPFLDFMKNAPSDLTQISERNGGRFPIETVYQIIADTDQQRAHGTSEMPIWGNRFNADVIAEEGEYGTGASGLPTAQARILELVYFLATIQEPN